MNFLLQLLAPNEHIVCKYIDKFIIISIKSVFFYVTNIT